MVPSEFGDLRTLGFGVELDGELFLTTPKGERRVRPYGPRGSSGVLPRIVMRVERSLRMYGWGPSGTIR